MGGDKTMRGNAARLLAAWWLLISTLGCGGGLIRSSGPSVEEVDGLKRRIVELQRQARVNEVEVARLKEEIGVLEKELATAREAAARGPANRAQEVEASVPSAAEDTELGPISLATGIEEAELEESEAPPPPAPPQPPSAVPSATPPPAPASPPPTTGTAPEPAPAAPSPEALRLYDEGYTLFHQKRYDEAEERFRRFLTLHGETELADNAQFWIGECRYARDDFVAALEAFTSTVELYPQGNKVADALLKAGKCLERLGRHDEARQTYHEITDRFPTSSAAVAARERLEALP